MGKGILCFLVIEASAPEGKKQQPREVAERMKEEREGREGREGAREKGKERDNLR